MAGSTLKVGMIGIGSYAASQHVPNLRATGRAEIKAISRRNPDRLKLAQETFGIGHAFTDWREMLASTELDAVVVCTPNHYHAEPTIAALEQGLHVLLEKPMALSADDARKMIFAKHAARRELMVGYNARGLSRWRAVKQLLESGTIGPVRQISAVETVDVRLFGDPDYRVPSVFQEMLQAEDLQGAFTGDLIRPGNWRADAARTGATPFIDIGTHLLDLVLWLGGGKPLQVSALVDNAGWEFENFITIQSRLDSQVAVSIMFGTGTSGGETLFYGRGRLTIHGDKGLMVADFDGFGPHDPTIWYEVEGERHELRATEPDTTTAAAFVKMVLDGAPNLASAEEAARVVALTEALRQSAGENRVVRIHYEDGDVPGHIR
jgi:predicted dehydrogenase